jgi:hypothetical protein
MRTHAQLITAGLVLSLGPLAYADFTPIPLDPTSFNQDPVIEKTAPPSLNDFVTVTPDQGTNKNGNTWYEKGYNTNNPTTGLPLHNSLVTVSNALNAHNYTFQMPPDYHGNCVLFVGHNNSTWTPILGPATFTFTTPAPYSALSILSGSGNGPCLIKYVIHFAGGATEEGTFSSTDWFSGNATTMSITRVYDAQGLLGLNGAVNNLSANHGVLFGSDVPLADTTDNITSIDFYWWGQNTAKNPYQNGRTFIFAVSGSSDGNNFSPIAGTGYNQDGVIEADAPHTFGSGSTALTGILTNDNTYCSFTMDGGIWKANWTWYEQGYYAAYPNSGIPAAGSTITSATQPTIHYTMPSTYVGNCAVCLSSNVPTAQIKFATPTSASALAFLAGGGNNGTPLNIRVEISFQGGGAETNWISMVDWFDRTVPWAWVSFGQVWPGGRAVRNTPDQFANAFIGGTIPFTRDPRLNGQLNPNVPNIRLYDLILPVSNSGGQITSINLVTTNTGSWTQTASILAVSGGAGAAPVITQPAGIVTDSATGVTNATTGVAQANNIVITKGYLGTNNITLWVSNRLGNAVSYQWKRAPKGGGWRDIYDTYDLSTFINVSAPNISGATSNFLTISNITFADAADYIVVASNPYGSLTSFVATVTVLTTNYSLLVGAGNGDTITKWSSDGTSGNGQETFTSAIDQVQQKWLSTGLGSSGFDGATIPQGTVPFVGPIGYIVTPAAGASFVNTIRFYCANDTPGRDPRDYLLEGSNDGGGTWTPITGGQLLGTLMLPAARGGTGSTPLNPMTQPLTEVDFPNSTSYKSYRITITNDIEPIATPLMQVAEIQLLGTFVPAPPTWVREPVPTMTVFVGTAPTFTASATGLGALAPTYQWYQTPSTLIAGATRSSYTITNVQLAASGTSYYCIAKNASGQVQSTSSLLNVIPAPTQSYPTAVLTDQPMGYWRLDEGPDNSSGNNGVLTHDYAGGHNGSYSNTVIGVSGYNPASDTNTAAAFGGTTPDSYVDNINDVSFARPSGSSGATFSVEAWVFGATPSGTPAIVTKGYFGILNVGTGTGTEQYAIDIAGGAFRFLVRDATGQGYQAVSTVKPSDPITLEAAWHHLVGVCDQPHSNLFLYVDGLLAATGTIGATNGIESQTLPTTFGARKSTQAADYDQEWVGTIDDVAVYPSALSASQVFNHFLAAQRPPLITLQPTNVIIADNVPVTFYSSAYGPGTLQYQWWLSDGTVPTTQLAGQTSSNLTFTTTTAQNGLFYQVVVSSQYGSTTSAVAQLTVVGGAPSFIVDLPASQVVYLGHIIQLHVVPGGTAPFTYQWQKNGVNLSDDFRTSGTHSDTLTMGYAATSDSGSYSVIVTGVGSTPSTTDVVTVTTNTGTFFNAGISGWQLNGPPALTTTSVQLTANLGNTARSAFLTTKQNISAFNIAFLYQDQTGAGGADGVTFCVQNQAVTAVGNGGGGLGYGGITPSFALQLNIYQPNTRGIAFNQNGAVTPPFASLLPNVGVGDNTNTILVNISYNGSILAATLRDTVTGGTVSTNYTVDIPTIVGGSTAWVGFTGADGGVASTQVITWGNLAVAVPIKLNAQQVGNTIVLSWPANKAAYLMSSPVVGPSAVWSLSTAPWQLVGNPSTGTQQVIVPTSSGANYYRLQLFP